SIRSVLSSSPPGAPRSSVTALSIPRPAYIAAHRPAGPAPTMITSYSLISTSLIFRPPFQSWGISLPGQGAHQVRAKAHRLELDVGPLRARQLPHRRRPDLDQAVPVAASPVQQGRAGLDQ